METEEFKHEHEEGSEEEAYVYLVHGVVPEFMPHIALRRAKHFRTAGRKIIRCPYCHGTFTTVDAGEKIELYQYPANVKVSRHEAMACGTCRRVVGIVYAA